IINKEPIEEYIIEPDKLISSQKRIVTRNCGIIDPENIDDYIKIGGYRALKKAKKMLPNEIIEIITKSGLRGRGGAGFLTGLKWKLTRQNPPPRFVICNADEGDPGAFMDRAVLESDPHSVLEGMAIGGYSIGADIGYIYVRMEYPLAIKRLETAIAQAEEKGLLDGFKIKIKEGAGAFVCGEETALIASIEGKRGMPRLRPPFPAQSGLFQRPTNINNVETWANIPWIILEGEEKFASLGTEKSKGTKVFCLAGKVKNPGLIEVEMGITLREIVFSLGSGIRDNKRFKAIQIGGPSGGCIPEALLDTPVDYDSVTKTGAIMGSGGMVIMDETTCMVDVARFFLNFIQDESCGKCTLCRIGTRRMLEILTRITEGKGEISDISLLEELALTIKSASLCGLGQTAPNPVLTTLKYFKNEYEAHIKHKKCPAKVCKALLTYSINPNVCTGCGLCAKKCPNNAISGEKKKPYKIEQEKCLKCGICYDTCKFGAIIVE
ncbi:MAG: NADH-ubiquinone oxidoreductase-F iron-sulfur binding region domain-containing protein, partial [bacterium]